MKTNSIFGIKIHLALAFGLVLAVFTAQAVDKYYTNNAAATYNNAASWNPNGVPGSSDNAINDNGSANVVQINSGDPNWNPWDVRAGNGTSASGAYYQNGPAVTVSGWFRLGVGSGGVGTYTLQSGTLTVTNGTGMYLRIGEQGTGTLNINGGTINHCFTGISPIIIGNRDTAVNYGSTVSSGTVNQSGGTLYSSGEIWIGQGSLGTGTSGTYNLHAGGSIFSTNWFCIGRAGATGLLTMDGGAVTKTAGSGNITWGTGAGNATINQSGGMITNTATATYMGEGGTCTWNISGGGAYMGTVGVGYNGAAKGMLNVSGTASFNVGQLNIGGNQTGTSTAQGYVNQTGGTVTATAADTRFGGPYSTADVNNVGIYTISAGTLNLPQTQIGAYGNGAMYLSGTGTVNANAGYPDVGRFAGGFGVLDVSGGIFKNNTTGVLLIIGEQGTGTMNVRGGAVTNASTASTIYAVSLGHVSGGVGVVNLLGGTLNTLSVGSPGAGSSTLNFNGGTLQARAANTTFVSALTKAYVRSGGAVIDDQGYALTIPQNLLAPTGSGVTSIPTNNVGAGYVAAPIVKITGGSGSGATAIAQISSSGTVTNILITSPGVDYASAPTVMLVGGSPTTAATIGTVTIGANTSGGLIKNGVGVLTLTGANTFTNVSTVNAGTVVVGNANALGTADGGTVVANNATVRALSTLVLAEPFTLNTTSAGALSVGSSANLTLNGPITVNAGTTIHADGGSFFTLNGNITGSNNNFTNDFNGSVFSTINGAFSLGSGLFDVRGNVILTSTVNSWSGGTVIEFGTLQIGNGGANGSLGTGTITDNGNLLFNSTSDLTINDVVQGSGVVTKQGAGTLRLGVRDTYTGATTISNGRLALSGGGSISNSPSIAVGSGAYFDVSSVNGGFALNGAIGQTLSGSGVVTGSVVAATGVRLSPGASAGTLSFSNNLTLNGGVTNIFELASTATEGSGVNDEIIVQGNLNLSGQNPIAITPTSGTLAASGRYILFRYGGTLNGSAANLPVIFTTPPSSPVSVTVDTSVAGQVALVVNLLTFSIPTVVTNIDTTSVGMYVRITADGGNGVTSWGVTYGPTLAPTNDLTTWTGSASAPLDTAQLVTGLTAGTYYDLRAWASNSVEGKVYSADTNFFTEPVAASGLTFSLVSNRSMTISWTSDPSAIGSVVFVRAGNPLTNMPADGTTYTATNQWAKGTDLGGSTYVVYNGTNTSVNVWDLPKATTYYVAVYTYAGSNSMINYQQDSLATGSQQTGNNLAPEAAGAVLIDLSMSRGALTNSDGALTNWVNYGTVGGSFTNDGTPDTWPSNTVAGSLYSVAFDGGDRLRATFAAPKSITGVNASSVPEDYSVEYWAYNPGLSDQEWIVNWSRRGTSPRFAGFGYGTNNAYGVAAHWATPDMAFGEGISTPGLASTPAAGVWHHIVVTYDGATERCYVDGVLNAQEAKVLNIWDGDPVTLGWALSATLAYESTPYSGSLAALRVHSGVLTPGQIVDNYTLGPVLLPVSIVSQPQSRSVYEYDTVSFSVGTLGTMVSYQWYRDGGLLNNGTNSTFTLFPTTNDNGAQFFCVASNYIQDTALSVTSSVVTLTVTPLLQGLIHRYSFNGDLVDSVGGASSGTLQGAAVISNGQLVLNGTVGTYASLPSWLVANRTSATIEFWASYGTSGNWARVFDFGDISGASGSNYILFSPHNGSALQNFDIRTNGAGTVVVDNGVTASPVLDGRTNVHVACVFDGSNGRMSIYTNGVLEVVGGCVIPLTSLSNVYSFLGKSLFASDSPLNASIDEFRIYSIALSSNQIRYTYTNGPDGFMPVAIASQPQPLAVTLLDGASVAFTNFRAVGSPPVTYQWYRAPGTLLTDATNTSYTFSSVQLSDAGTQFYCVAANVSGGVACTATSALAMVTAVVTAPDTQASGLVFNNLSNRNMSVSWTLGSGGSGTLGSLVLVRQGAAITNLPVDGVAYAASNQFAKGFNLGGDGTYVAFAGTGTSVNLWDMSKNTTYYVAVLAYSSTNGVFNYLQTVPLTGSQATLNQAIIEVAGEVLIDLNVDRGLQTTASGGVSNWVNYGTVPGSFTNIPVFTQPTVGSVGGVQAVAFASQGMKATFTAPKSITGVNATGQPEDYSLEMWLNNPAIVSEEWLFGWARGQTTLRAAAFGYGNNAAYAVVGHWDAPDMGFDGGVPAAGVWHHIVVTYDGVTEKVYVDGVLNAQEAKTLNIWDGDPVTLGVTQMNDYSYRTTLMYNGWMAALRVHSGALSPGQVADNYAMGAALTSPPQFVVQPQNVNVNEAIGTASFSATAFGTPQPDYQWFSNDVAVAGGTATTLAFSGLTPSANGANIYCVASNYANSTANMATSSVAVLTINPVQAGLYHRYSFTNDATDSVGGAHGTLQGSAFVQGLRFDGATTYINVPVTNSAARTLAAWVNPQNSMTVAHIASVIDCDVGGQYGAGWGVQNGKFRVLLDDTFWDTGISATLYQWQHVALSFTTNLATLYVNGVAAASTNYPQGAVNTTNFYIGRSHANAEYWNGGIYDAQIYDHNLTSNEVANLCLGTTNTGLLGRYLTTQTLAAGATDTSGNARNGTWTGTATNGMGGALTLLSGNSYMNLPGGLITGYTNLTVEFWATFYTNSAWARVFDFGNTNGIFGVDYLMFTPHDSGGNHQLILRDNLTSPTDYVDNPAAGSGSMDGKSVHVACVYDSVNSRMSIYTNGAFEVSAPVTIPLAAVSNVYSFIGQSLFTGNPYLRASIDELRIYQVALTDAQVFMTHVLGQNQVLVEQAVQIVTQPTDQTVAEGTSNTTFAVLANGKPPIGFQWYRSDDSIIDGATSTTYTLPVAGLADAGGYYCVASNVYNAVSCMATSRVASLTVIGVAASLAHWYPFYSPDGGYDLFDHMWSGVNGNPVGAVVFTNNDGIYLDGSPGVLNSGLVGNYVELPSGIINTWTAATFEFWATFGTQGSPGTAANWSRVFDFGYTNGVGGGANYIMFTPHTDHNTHRFEIVTTAGSALLDPPGVLDGRTIHVACVYDPASRFMAIYTNGVMEVSTTTTVPLTAVSNVYAWIGRSLFTNDAYLKAEIDDFRLYNAALSPSEVLQSYQQGKDTPLGQGTAIGNGSLVIASAPADATVDYLRTAVFSVQAAGEYGAPLTYQWYYSPSGSSAPSSLMVGQTGSTLTLNGVTTNVAGSYTVAVTNANTGEGTELSATLTVLQVMLTGTVTLEAYQGTAHDGAGMRDVRFSYTDGVNYTNHVVQTLTFAGGAAPYSFVAPQGATRVSAKTAWTLRTTVAVSLPGTPVADFVLRCGDLDGSNTVGLADYYQLAAAWYQPDAAADIDGSGLADGDDYFLLANHWGEAGDAE